MAPKNINFAERQEIERLYKLGTSFNQIAKLIGRSKTSISREINTHGGKAYTAVRAQQERDQTLKNRMEKLPKILKENHPYKGMLKRLESLEMQIKILFETIKRLNNK